LTFYVIRYAWKYPLWLCISATSVFFVVDLAFWSSNMLKLVDGGWFPLFLGGMILVLMLTWRDGRALLHHKTRNEAIDLSSFLEALFIAPPTRVDGTAVFLTSEDGIVPNALLHNLKHNKVLHAQNLFVSVRSHEVPWIPKEKRIELTDMGNQCWQVKIHYGFKDDPDVPGALSLLKGQVGSIDPMSTSYFLSRDSIVPTVGGGMAQWREKLFAQMYLNASAAADFLNLPSNSVVEMGSKIEI
jgi:KUP system potassium uptake protein